MEALRVKILLLGERKEAGTVGLDMEIMVKFGEIVS